MAKHKRLKQKVPFRLIQTPCCHILLCWVNSRLPNYCPECGERIYAKLKFDGILAEATEAWLETVETIDPLTEGETNDQN